MLVSALLMFAQDYFREWKPEQRVFREVESKLAQRMAIDQIPADEELDAAEKAVSEARKAHDEQQAEIAKWKKQLAVLQPDREKENTKVNGIKSDFGSIQSLYYIDLEHGNVEEAKHKREHLDKLSEKLAAAEAKRDAIETEMKGISAQIDTVDADLTKKIGTLKKLNDKFDAAVNMSIKKEWGWADAIPRVGRSSTGSPRRSRFSKSPTTITASITTSKTSPASTAARRAISASIGPPTRGRISAV